MIEIIGGVVAGVVVLALVFGALWYYQQKIEPWEETPDGGDQ